MATPSSAASSRCDVSWRNTATPTCRSHTRIRITSGLVHGRATSASCTGPASWRRRVSPPSNPCRGGRGSRQKTSTSASATCPTSSQSAAMPGFRSGTVHRMGSGWEPGWHGGARTGVQDGCSRAGRPRWRHCPAGRGTLSRMTSAPGSTRSERLSPSTATRECRQRMSLREVFVWVDGYNTNAPSCGVERCLSSGLKPCVMWQDGITQARIRPLPSTRGHRSCLDTTGHLSVRPKRSSFRTAPDPASIRASVHRTGQRLRLFAADCAPLAAWPPPSCAPRGPGSSASCRGHWWGATANSRATGTSALAGGW